MFDEPASAGIAVLAKIGLPRANPDWHYHLANPAGRPRCGALLNLREWQVREFPHPPGNLCARCARLLRPRGQPRIGRLRVPLSAAPGDKDPEQGEQLDLPLDE